MVKKNLPVLLLIILLGHLGGRYLHGENPILINPEMPSYQLLLGVYSLLYLLFLSFIPVLPRYLLLFLPFGLILLFSWVKQVILIK